LLSLLLLLLLLLLPFCSADTMMWQILLLWMLEDNIDF